MEAGMHQILLVCSVILGLLLPSFSLCAQTEAEQIERVFRDWQKRQERIQRIRYVVKGECIKPKGSITDEMGRPMVPPQPPKDIAEKQDNIVLLDIPGKRFRMERDEQNYWYQEKRLVPLLATTVFDSKSTSTAIPREENANAGYVRGPAEPDVMISKNDAAYHPLNALTAYWLSPLLFAHGFISKLIAAPSFLEELDIDDFQVHGQAEHAGRPCLVLRTYPITNGTSKSFDEYWVDLARDSAVLRHSGYMDDKLYTDVDITYQQTSEGWIPQRWVGITRNYNNGGLISLTRLRVAEFTVNPSVSDADFQVEIKPGMLVSVTETKPTSQTNPPRIQRTWYRVAADGRWQEIDQQTGLLRQPSWRRWLALAEFMALIALGYLVWRRLRVSPDKRLSSNVR